MTRKTTTKEYNDLTPMQQAFVSLFDGSIKRTAVKANISYPYARQLYSKGYIKQAIAHRHHKELNPHIASRQDRQTFWTDIMNDKSKGMADRLKASELLAKSEGDFIEKVSITNPAMEMIDSERKQRALQIVCLFGDIYQLGDGQSGLKPSVKMIESAVIDAEPAELPDIISVSPEPVGV